MATVIWAKTISQGEITVDSDFVIRVAGAEIGKAEPYAVRIKPTVVKGITVVGLLAGKVALTAADVEAYNAAAGATIAARPKSLAEQRAAFVSEIRSLRDEQQRTFDRMHAQEDARDWMTHSQYETQIAAAVAARDAFDAAHPEIIAEIKAKRAAETAAAVERANRWD